MNDTKPTWDGVEQELLPLSSGRIVLMEQMLESATRNYVRNNKLYAFRQLCFGFLHTACNNCRATLKLLEENLIDQIHFLNRNSFEMAVILLYIDDDKRRKGELTQRFFDYSIVAAHKAMKVMHEYPESFADIETEDRDKEVERKYRDFKLRYCTNSKNLNTWSGKNLLQMIEGLTNIRLKDDLVHLYKGMLQGNNIFLHPSEQALRTSILRCIRKEVDYAYRSKQLISIIVSTDYIIEKFLDNFSRGRMSFRDQFRTFRDEQNRIATLMVRNGLVL